MCKKTKGSAELIGVTGATNNAYWGNHKLLGRCLIAHESPHNLVSFQSLIKDGFNVSYDNKRNHFVVTKGRQCSIIFYPIRNLYATIITRIVLKNGSIYWIGKRPRTGVRSSQSPVMATETAEETQISYDEDDDAIQTNPQKVKRIFSQEQIKRAEEARKYHVNLNHPCDKYFSEMLNKGMIPGMHLRSADVHNSNILFGRCVTCLKSKLTNKPKKASTSPKSSIVGEVLHADIMFYNGMMHLISVDQASGFVMGLRLHSKTSRELLHTIKAMLRTYASYGHRVRTIVSDRERGLADSSTTAELNSLGITLRRTTTRGHESTVERTIRTIEERIRCAQEGMQYVMPAILL